MDEAENACRETVRFILGTMSRRSKIKTYHRILEQWKDHPHSDTVCDEILRDLFRDRLPGELTAKEAHELLLP